MNLRGGPGGRKDGHEDYRKHTYMAHVPDPPSAEVLVGALRHLDVDCELVSDRDFRALLAALNYEASYEPTKRELTIR